MLMVVERESDRLPGFTLVEQGSQISPPSALSSAAMSQAAWSQPAEPTSMELEGSATDAAAPDLAAAGAAAALAGLSAESAPAAAASGQSDACHTPRYLPRDTCATSTHPCFRVLSPLLYRCPVGASWSRPPCSL